MPMSRYEIRNEYSLADPELYRAADKDDPEALLEGVAMAGLVGVLRQLGDLAEFAAEIFHDLHEEVVATAARGHNLMARVQQLESEVPFIEKSFLTQTDHSPFFYNAGVDWHPNVQINKNLVTQGDLPRFIMDSYEECRGPPRLFLLDKFDVAGAGACLKRYTDPSFFKVETPEITTTDIQREKKIRKIKKKGPRWRNGETPEVLPTSNAKLHQLFLKERVENAVSNPARRVKLKRRLNGFPFDSKAGKSYMEKFLKTPSPDHNELSEVNMSSPLSMLPIDDRNEPGLEVIVVRPVTPNRERVRRKRSPPPDNEKILDVSMYEPNKISRDDKVFEVPNSYTSIMTDEISSTTEYVTGKKDISVNKEGKVDSNLIGYQSDDIASEIDNYVDAPSTMESEIDTDSETRVKRDFTSSLIKALPLVSDSKDEDLHTQSLDSQSSEEPTMSDDGNNSSKKASSSFTSSESPSSLTDNPHLENKLSEHFQSADALETHIENASPYQKTADEDFLFDQHPEPMVSDHISTTTVPIVNHRSDFEQLTSSLCSIGSIPTSKHSDTERFFSNETIRRPEDDIASASDDEERKNNLVIHTPSSPSVTDLTSQSGDDSPRSFAEEHAVDRLDGEKTTSLSESDNLRLMDNSVAISSDLLNEDDSNRKDPNLVGGMSSSSSMYNVLSPKGNDTSEIVPTENLIRGNLDHEVPMLPENCILDCPDIAQNGDNTASMVSKEQKKCHELYKEELNVSTDSSSRLSYIMDTSHGEELDETSSVNVHNINAKGPYSNSSIHKQISSENLILTHVENSPDCPETILAFNDKDLISEEETTLNENLIDPPKSCVVEDLHDLEVKDDLISNDSATLESSCGTQENLEGSAGQSDAVENGGITLITRSIGAEVAENWGAADMNEAHALQGESDSETNQLEIADKASTEPVVSDDAYRNNVSLHVDLDESIEDHTPFEDLNMEFEKNYPSGSHKELGILEEMGQMETATSGLDQVFCNPVDYGQLKPEVLDNSPNTYLDLGVEDNLDSGDASSIQSAMEKSVLDVEQETIPQYGLGIHASDDSSVPISSNNEEKIPQEESKSLLNQLELLDLNKISSGLSPLVPTDSQQKLDHGDNKCENKSASMLSIVNSHCPRSLADLPRLSSNGSDVSEYPDDPLKSRFPPSNHFSETNQLNLDESPPLPPLPPMQWWKDKLQQVSPTTSTEAVSSSHADMNHSPVQYLPGTASKDEKLEHSLSSSETNSMYVTFQHQPTIENEPQQTPVSTKEVNSLAIEGTNSLIHLCLKTASEIDKVEYISSKLESSAMDETIDLPPNRANELQKPTPFKIGDSSSLEESNHSLIHINPDTVSKEKKVQHSSSSLEADALHKANDHPPKIENEQKKIVKPFLVSEITSPAEEERSRTVKLSRPRNPLIESVAALDKSKLRKVTERVIPERVIPESQKVDNSILEQIRAKSFNLKPAIVSRPSIRGPRTNNSVAAILEKKANAIRQALAGSDEEDNWSDS